MVEVNLADCSTVDAEEIDGPIFISWIEAIMLLASERVPVRFADGHFPQFPIFTHTERCTTQLWKPNEIPIVSIYKSQQANQQQHQQPKNRPKISVCRMRDSAGKVMKNEMKMKKTVKIQKKQIDWVEDALKTKQH